MNLTVEQKDFLEHHKIDGKLIFDANGTGLVGKDLKQSMYNSDTLFAVGTNNCNFGHNIKTRSGHCPVCNTERIAHTLRTIEKEAYIYVVGSIEGKVIKVGFTKDLEDRLFHLNKDNYGGFCDWDFLYHAKYKKAGKIEIELHSKLDNYNFLLSYNHYGKEIKCYELFKCGYSIIREIIIKYNNEIGLNNIKEIFELENAKKIYNFSVIQKNEKRIGEKHNKKDIEKIEKDIEKKVTKKNKKKELFSEKGTGEFIKNIRENIVFYSEIDIDGKEYGIFNIDNSFGIADIETGEIMGDTFDECGKIIEIDGSYLLNIKKSNKWNILNIKTENFLYGDYDYIYEIDFTGYVKISKNGTWKVLDLGTGEFDSDMFDSLFEPIIIDDKKYIKVIDGYVEVDTGKYVGGKFDRIRNIKIIGNKYYFGVFKDITYEEYLCGIVDFEKKEIVGSWFDLLDYNFDEYDGDDDNLEFISYLINGKYCIKITDKEKDGVLNLETGKIIGKTFDRILEIKEFYGKYYFIIEKDIETGIYSVEKNQIIGPMFSDVIDYFEIGGNIYVKIKDGDEVGYVNLNSEELLGDTYEEVSDIQDKNGVLYFSFSYFDGSYGLYDISNNNTLKNIDFFDIKINNESNNFIAKGLKITSGFDNTGNTETINGKQYMPVQIGTREGIYCHTDRIIIGDLYDQLGYTKTSYGEYKNCDINKHGESHYFTVKNGWKYGNINLETGEFKERGLFENIMSLLGF